MGPLGLRIRDGGVQGLTSGNADCGGLVGGCDGEVKGGRESAIPAWQVNISWAAGRLLFVVGTGGQKQAWLLQLSLGHGSLLVAEIQHFVPHFVVSHSPVSASSTLATVVATIVEHCVAQRTVFS